MEIDGQRRPVAIFGYLGVHYEILNLDLAKSIDGVCHPPQERRHITLALTSRVGLAEVLHSPGRSLAHRSSLQSPRPHSSREWGARSVAGGWLDRADRTLAVSVVS